MQPTESASASDDKPHSDLANRELRVALEQSIDQLPLESRGVFMLRGVQQLSTEDTALSLGLSEDVVKTRYLRAKRKLRELLEQQILQAGVKVHEFAGWRCDQITQQVMRQLLNN